MNSCRILADRVKTRILPENGSSVEDLVGSAEPVVAENGLKSTEIQKRPLNCVNGGVKAGHRGGRGFQEAGMISPISELAAAAFSSVSWGARRRLAVDCLSR